MLYGVILEVFMVLVQVIGKFFDDIMFLDVKNFKIKDEMLFRVGEVVVGFVE